LAIIASRVHHILGRESLRTATRAAIAVFFAMSAIAAPGPIPAFAAGSAKASTKVCGAVPAPGFARCLSQRRTDPDATNHAPVRSRRPVAQPSVLGNSGAYDPSYLQSAYALTAASASAGAGSTIAIVDAYDSPTAEADMDFYRSYFGLPACAAGGCFTKVDQTGGTSYPVFNSGWAQEISLDLDMASAVCPQCKILLVEAADNHFTNLGTAVNTAARLGATAISNSYGGSEFSSETTYDSQYYNHPGIAVTASSGDNGYGVEYPAASKYVTAVGGTSLNQADNLGSRNATETAWSGAGSGCSLYEAKPSWQTDSGCSKRTVADTSAVADPNTGVWAYDNGSWYIFGGTSVASPIIASIYALDGAQSAGAASSLYANSAALNDVTSGSNGSCGSYLCVAGSGYDGPTGLGTPNGTTAFAPVPDFSVALSPSSQSITPGGSTSYSVTITPSGGFSGVVSLALTGGPADLSSAWTPSGPVTIASPAAATSTLTVASSTVGSYSLTITATAGALVHTAAATLVVKAPSPDFTISASPSSQTIARTGSTTYAVAITPLNGFGNAVTLSVSGLPNRSSASFSPNPTTSSSTLTVSTSRKTATGTYTLTITATGGGVTHTTTVTLTVQ
jgi:subtilase family serine protease